MFIYLFILKLYHARPCAHARLCMLFLNVVIQDVQVHWLKHTDDLLLQCLLDGGAGLVSLNILFSNVASGADLSCCSICCCWCPPGGVWCYPKCWFLVRCWGNHNVRSIRDDEAQVSQCASAQVGVDGSRVCLEKLSGGVGGLIIRLALNCW
jgi:hypothetical protein